MKNIEVTTTRINNFYLNHHANGDVTCQIGGVTKDSDGNIVGGVSTTVFFSDLPPQVQNNLNNVMKHMSRVLNNEGAEEDSETWIDK